MLNINDRLNDIIIKYNLDKHYPRFKQSIKAIELLKQLFSSHKDVFFVASSETDMIYIKRHLNAISGLKYVIVDVGNAEFFNKVEINNNTIIVVSYYCKNEISVKLYEKDINHVNLYDYFNLNGCYIEHDYYNIFGGEYLHPRTRLRTYDFYHYSPYEEIIKNKKIITNTQANDIKKIYFERLIFKLFYIKDFVSADKYINEYALHFNYDMIDYRSAWVEVLSLLEDIKQSLDCRKHSDIMTFLIDSVEYGEDKYMPFVGGMTEQALTFENVYTCTPYTTSTLISMSLGLKAIDDSTFDLKKISCDGSDFLSYLTSNKMNYKYYGMKYDKFDEQLSVPPELFNHTASMTYWDTINEMIQSDKSTFHMSHSLFETHAPFLSVDLVDDSFDWVTRSRAAKSLVLQAESSIKYVDKQIEFYTALLPSNMTKIYMSDHGRTKYGRFHTILKIKGDRFPIMLENRLFSLLDFGKLVNYIINPSDLKYNKLFEEDSYSIQDINYLDGNVVAWNMGANKFKPELLMGYRGVVTETDTYLSYDHGVEYFHKHKNDNELFLPERVEYLRSLVSTVVINMEENKKFKYTKYLNMVVDRYNKRNSEYENRKAKLLKSLFEGFDNNLNIAIYSGKETSFKLLMLMGLDLCKKVSYIVDVEPDCIAGKLGIPVINPDNIGKIPIDIIIQTRHHSTPSRFGVGLYEKENPVLGETDCNVIDIYSYLDNNGIKCTRDFWMLELDETDFDIDFPFLEVYKNMTGLKV